MTNPTHALMPTSSHDEAARFGYVIGLKSFLLRRSEAAWRELVDQKLAPKLAERGRDAREEYRGLERTLRELGLYRAWRSLSVAAQREMWRSVAACVDRQQPQLEAAARAHADAGSVRVDPAFEPPRYLTAVDIHLMPGGYHADRGPQDLRQGAIFDKAAAIYHMGRNGGELNDVRGHTIVQHLFERFPDLEPRRILDLGCTVGHSTVAIASYFPGAEVHAVDVGAALLRYARARAASLGASIHFSQQNAEKTDFPDGSFDLVVSSAVLHETSNRALPRILAECRRLLRPGGVMIHLEVPMRFENSSTWSRIRGLFEALHNNEPFWVGAVSADIAGAARACGLREVAAGYQGAVSAAQRGASAAFTQTAGAVHSCWYMVSGRK